jgi:hypothetical protein
MRQYYLLRIIANLIVLFLYCDAGFVKLQDMGFILISNKEQIEKMTN